MAKKIIDRCCICNEKLVNGYCRFCGYDNSRNDRYRTTLNMHAASSTLPQHAGSCDSTLNKPRRQASRSPIDRAQDRQRTKTYAAYRKAQNPRSQKTKQKGSFFFRLLLLLAVIIGLLLIYGSIFYPVSASVLLQDPITLIDYLIFLIYNLVEDLKLYL